MPLPSAVFQWPHVCPVTLPLSPSNFMLVFLSVMRDLTIVFIWLHVRLSVTSCMSCTTLPLSSSDFHARLSVASCLSCTILPPSSSDFHARLSVTSCLSCTTLPLNSCTSFCDLMSFSEWHKLYLVLSLCPSPAASCLFDRDLCYLFGCDLMFMFFSCSCFLLHVHLPQRPMCRLPRLLLLSSVRCGWRWYLCARKSPHALHPVSQKFLRRCLCCCYVRTLF